MSYKENDIKHIETSLKLFICSHYYHRMNNELQNVTEEIEELSAG